MSKVYIFISTQNEFENIKELTSVYEHFDGICAVDHFSNDGTYKLLKERCKDGFVEQIPYYGAHQHDLNHLLFNPKIKIGDWILLRDSSERINPNFASNIRPFINHLRNLRINSLIQRSKLLLFRRFPQQFFSSSPHWGFQGGRDNYADISQATWFADDKEYCYSVRDETRNKYHFIDAFMRYYLINDSNHCLLGIENFNNPKETFIQLEQERLDFLLYLQELGINNDVDSLGGYLGLLNPLPERMKYFINSNLILNQFYRYYILNDLTVSPDIKAPIVKIS